MTAGATTVFTLTNFVALCVAIAATWAALSYARLAIRKEIEPALATWILMFTMMLLSLVMYLQYREISVAGNIGVIAGFFNVLIVLIGVIRAGYIHGTLRNDFRPFQVYCVIAGIGLVPVWLIALYSDIPYATEISYAVVQLIAIVAYIATIGKLKTAPKLTEPYFLWVVAFVTSVMSIYPAVMKEDVFGYIYLARAVPSTAYVVYLVWRIKRRMAGRPEITRDMVAKTIHWKKLIWIGVVINVGAMLPQLHDVIRSRQTEDISLATIGIYLFVQCWFAIDFYFNRNRALLVCMVLSAMVSATLIVTVLYFRSLI